VLLLVSACSNPLAEEPPVRDSIMVEVLVDAHLAERRHTLEQDVGVTMREAILARHGLDSAAYASAVAYFADHPEEYAALYDKVVERLHAERERLDTLRTVR
jgi:hypothetical protein